MSMISVQAWLDFALQQAAAECYLDNLSFSQPEEVKRRLELGNNHYEMNPFGEGATKFTGAQADYFLDKFEIIMHYPNDSSGFSCTVFKNRTTGEYTLSFRSTEYEYGALDVEAGRVSVDKGGDWARDGAPGADGDITDYGFCLAQLSSMEKVFQELTIGRRFDSLSGEWVSDPALAGFSSDTSLNIELAPFFWTVSLGSISGRQPWG